jgi:hypothetical protein
VAMQTDARNVDRHERLLRSHRTEVDVFLEHDDEWYLVGRH